MAREEDSSSGQGNLQTVVPPGEADRNNGSNSKSRTRVDTKPRKKKIPPKRTVDRATLGTIERIVIALFGLIGTVIAGWFAYKAAQPALPPLSQAPTPSFTTIPSETAFFTNTPTEVTETPSPTILPEASPLPSFTSVAPTIVVPSESATRTPDPVLIVVLAASKNSGNKPLRVKLDARDSYMIDLTGERLVCRDGDCHYTWRVYFEGHPEGDAINDTGGTLDYVFTKRGAYRIAVWVCRGRDRLDCGGAGAHIIVT